MRVRCSISSPVREGLSWDSLWRGDDHGLILCWERGRAKAKANPSLSARALAGELVPLQWKGGVEIETKKKEKYGTLYYLAMLQGLRGQDLDIDLDDETTLTCSRTQVTVIFTGVFEKYANA